MRFSTKFALAACSTVLFGVNAHAADITGAGATFPAPIYSKWADAYQKATGNRMNYQSIGSGGGIRQIGAKTVDFGASDMPLYLYTVRSVRLSVTDSSDVKNI